MNPQQARSSTLANSEQEVPFLPMVVPGETVVVKVATDHGAAESAGGAVRVIQKREKWYHGGIASSMAACFTHPFDLIKVQLQTPSLQQGNVGILPLTRNIIHSQGFLALYNGISASLLRQMTYSTARFGIYQALKPKDSSQSLSFLMKCVNAGVAGGIGGLIGAPADLLNVRMQNDSKVPVDQRRNYKHAVDGLIRVSREEGVARLWKGSSMVVTRSVFMTIGQLSFYDQIKQMLLASGMFTDTVPTHLLASSLADSKEVLGRI